MATSLRLPDVLKSEATAYAADLGISVNALVAVALRDYLDRRARRRPGLRVAPDAVPALAAATAATATPVVVANRALRRKVAVKKRKR